MAKPLVQEMNPAVSEMVKVRDHRGGSGFLAGALIGAAAAILLAPASGRVTRSKISGAAMKARDGARKVLRRGARKSSQAGEAMSSAMNDAANRLA